ELLSASETMLTQPIKSTLVTNIRLAREKLKFFISMRTYYFLFCGGRFFSGAFSCFFEKIFYIFIACRADIKSIAFFGCFRPTLFLNVLIKCREFISQV